MSNESELSELVKAVRAYLSVSDAVAPTDDDAAAFAHGARLLAAEARLRQLTMPVEATDG
jgi:hypothetical protein